MRRKKQQIQRTNKIRSSSTLLTIRYCCSTVCFYCHYIKETFQRRLLLVSNMNMIQMKEDKQQIQSLSIPSLLSSSSPFIIYFAACAYVTSGVCQPLLMQVCKDAGLADSRAQLYMIAYYIGPASLMLTLQRQKRHLLHHKNSNNNCDVDDDNGNDNNNDDNNTNNNIVNDDYLGTTIPNVRMILKATFVAIFDIVAQSLNYAGAGMAGPTIFAVIYSSVTIWTAVFSFIWLHRTISTIQWLAVFIVFFGLCLTGQDSIHLGPNVVQGTILIVIGSCLHGGTYVMSESIMNGISTHDRLSIRQNTAIQGMVAFIGLGIWQIVYTIPRWDVTIHQPMIIAQTSVLQAWMIMFAFAVANFIHSIAFYHVLKYYPGGSTSAGVMKGLQAVLVFVFAHITFCGHGIGSHDGLCFTLPKLFSLVTVVIGVILFSSANTTRSTTTTTTKSTTIQRCDYTPIHNEVNDDDVDVLAISS